ncbi:hypothetical protein D9K81_18025 [Acinetobacter chengduensis]|uniref:Uncharacterized protein n=1 Tax=Acinetobacter chengduensis TaxID=2420890 RepID=A0ABX9TQV5_9GAMM|nr:hypothetical protein D9K81_18025 [Acinetobacter chengduensis]
MIAITKKGELMIIDENSSITGHQFIGVIITDPTKLDDSCMNIVNHFYSKDHQQLDKLVLEALHTSQNHHHLLSEQP